MADHSTSHSSNSGSGSTGAMAFILGGLVVAVAIGAWVMFEQEDDLTLGTDNVNVTIEGGQSAAENAADAVEDAASGAAEAVSGN